MDRLINDSDSSEQVSYQDPSTPGRRQPSIQAVYRHQRVDTMLFRAHILDLIPSGVDLTGGRHTGAYSAGRSGNNFYS
jgi:hypothetical protein